MRAVLKFSCFSIFRTGWFEPLDENQVPMKPSPHQLNELIAETHLNHVNFARGKSKMAVWFVSACNSMSSRNEYVDRLKLFIDVDVFGNCGTKQCSLSDPVECRKMAAHNYKFYLALENSLCTDYVSEKFFGPMHYNIIPIVFDLHGNHEKLAPPHSYINAAQFQSVRDLADYLRLLNSNDRLYNEYFWWKKHYVVRDVCKETIAEDDNKKIKKTNVDKIAMCQLCQRLHQQSIVPQNKIYRNMTDWWDIQANCQTAQITTPLTQNDESHYWKAVPSLVKLFV